MTTLGWMACAAIILFVAGALVAYRKTRRPHAHLSHALLANTPDIIAGLSSSGQWLYASPAITHTLGWTPEETIGLAFNEWVHPDDAPLLALPGDSIQLDTLRLRHKLGHWVWVEAHGVPAVDPRSPELFWVMCVRDITARRNAEIVQIQAHARLAQQASIDGLTGLFNRGHILAMLEKECARSRRSLESLCVLLIDIDHFKPLNDYFGHQHGDSCLKSVADCLGQAVLRPADAVGRYGGEEFMVLLPDTDARGMMNVAEKIRQAVEDLRQPHPASPFKHVTVSVGGVHIPAVASADPSRYIGLADSALYRAKRMGRNRVVCSTDPQGGSTSENVTLAPDRDQG